LYPCGEVLWFIPSFLKDSNVSGKDKYKRLLKLIGWQAESSYFVQALQVLYRIIADFYVVENNEVLTSIHAGKGPFGRSKSEEEGNEQVMKLPNKPSVLVLARSSVPSVDRFEVDRFEFTQMVAHGMESFCAHLPGRYTNGFDINIKDLIAMSQRYNKWKLVPLPVILILLISVFVPKIILQWFGDLVVASFMKIRTDRVAFNPQKKKA